MPHPPRTTEEWQREVERLQRELDWAALRLVQSRNQDVKSSKEPQP
jgi:hypothetical protein